MWRQWRQSSRFKMLSCKQLEWGWKLTPMKRLAAFVATLVVRRRLGLQIPSVVTIPHGLFFYIVSFSHAFPGWLLNPFMVGNQSFRVLGQGRTLRLLSLTCSTEALLRHFDRFPGDPSHARKWAQWRQLQFPTSQDKMSRMGIWCKMGPKARTCHNKIT